MNNQFIQTAVIKWDKIAEDSYLRKIEAFSLTTLQFWRVVFGGAVLGKYDETEEKEVLFPRNAVFKVINWFQLSR